MIGDPSVNNPPTIAVSVVIFQPDVVWLERTLRSLAKALSFAHEAEEIGAARIYLVDNGAATRVSDSQSLLDGIFQSSPPWLSITTIAGQGNRGYGAGNNLAFARDADADFLLVLNPDVDMDSAAIANGVRFLRADENCAMVTPVAAATDGSPLYLVKREPRVTTLLLRGFAPAFVQSWFAGRMADYERRSEGWDTALDDVRHASGCFMLMRRPAFDLAGGFDEEFFLYFEDFDLSLRISQSSRIARCPDCRILHDGGGASAKGLGHVWMFARSAVRFFNKHGWRW
ncbi:MAG: glycosyltransferase family 2 protein [Betaproteobacteria bacterium]|nr:glycosyltransferase family 2 protein [Betaproteobacteria bacterium]